MNTLHPVGHYKKYLHSHKHKATHLPVGPLLSEFCHCVSLVSDFATACQNGSRRRIYLCGHHL